MEAAGYGGSGCIYRDCFALAYSEYKKTTRKAAVAVINIGVALMLAMAVGMIVVMMMTPAGT